MGNRRALGLLAGAGVLAGGTAVSAAAWSQPQPERQTQAPPLALSPPGPAGTPVAAGVVRRTLAYLPGGPDHQLDVYLPADAPVRPRPTVLLLHGGSWAIGDKVEWVDQGIEIARRGWTAVSVNYRTTATARWPAPEQDARAALDYVRAHAPSLGVDPDRVGALGDSAGGQLAALLGQARPGSAPVRAVVTWSGINDLSGLLQQPSSGGCTTPGCRVAGLAGKVTTQLMGCRPAQCPGDYRAASAAADVGPDSPATLAVGGEAELIDPRQAWVMDSALHRAGRPSRVLLLPGHVHGRGNQAAAWPASLRFLAAVLTPETAPPFPRPHVEVALQAPATGRVGAPVRLSGAVTPRAAGSTVALQVKDGGTWRTVRVAPLATGPDGTTYDLGWTPDRAGTSVWRAVWTGSGGHGVSVSRTVRVAA